MPSHMLALATALLLLGTAQQVKTHSTVVI